MYQSGIKKALIHKGTRAKYSRGATQISLSSELTKKPVSDATGIPFLAALKASLTFQIRPGKSG
jgi:hypothetical protein